MIDPQISGNRRFGILHKMTIYHTVGSMVIRSIDQLVDFFGGNSALAAWLGIDPTAVAQWKLRGQIGSGWHLILLSEVRRRGSDVHIPSVFGLTEDQSRGLALKTRAVA